MYIPHTADAVFKLLNEPVVLQLITTKGTVLGSSSVILSPLPYWEDVAALLEPGGGVFRSGSFSFKPNPNDAASATQAVIVFEFCFMSSLSGPSTSASTTTTANTKSSPASLLDDKKKSLSASAAATHSRAQSLRDVLTSQQSSSMGTHAQQSSSSQTTTEHAPVDVTVKEWLLSTYAFSFLITFHTSSRFNTDSLGESLPVALLSVRICSLCLHANLSVYIYMYATKQNNKRYA